jgi:hypothetical protein
MSKPIGPRKVAMSVVVQHVESRHLDAFRVASLILVMLAIVLLVGGQGLLERILPQGTVEYIVGGVAGACISLVAIAAYVLIDTARLNRELHAERARREAERAHPV